VQSLCSLSITRNSALLFKIGSESWAMRSSYVAFATADNNMTSGHRLLELKHTDLADSDGSQNAHDKGRDKALSADPKVDVYTRDRLAIVENT